MSSINRDLQHEQARAIANYWARYGAKVDVQVVRDPTAPDHAPSFVIRSNMVNGLPRRAGPDLIRRLIENERLARNG